MGKFKQFITEQSNDDILSKYFDYVEKAMKKISPKLTVSFKSGSIFIKLRGRKPIGQEIASKLNTFFDNNKVEKYGDWFSYGKPIEDKETQIQIIPYTNDSIGKKLGLDK